MIQKQKLRDSLAINPQLRSGKFSNIFTHKDAQREWEQIATTLNSIPGTQKDWKAWRKTWQDITSKVKKKSATVKRVQQGTGGGPPPDHLDEFEEGVAALIHPYAIVGHSGEESEVHFQYEAAGDNMAISIEDHLESYSSQEEPLVVIQVVEDVAEISPPLAVTSIGGPSGSSLPAPSPQDSQIEELPTLASSNIRRARKKKLNLKELMREKIDLKNKEFQLNKEKLDIKKQELEEKKKFYLNITKIMERQAKAIEEIGKAVNK